MLLGVRPNNSFKPNPLRSGNGVAEKACHAVACTTQVGLTQVLGGMDKFTVNPTKVPRELRHLIPLAKYFGIPDDLEREMTVNSASSEMLQQLRTAVIEHDNFLDDWLAGPEASGPNFSDEYIVFTAMRMAADSAA